MATLAEVKAARAEKNKDFLRVELKGCEAEVYYKHDKNRDVYLVKAFAGRAEKPSFFYRFSTKERAMEYVINWQAGLIERQAKKAERQAEKKSFEHNVQVGDIFYTSWGYDQTNIDFYQVISVKGQTAEIREIEPILKWDENLGDRGYCIPSPSNFKPDSKPLKKRIQSNYNGSKPSFKIASYAHAMPVEYTEVAGVRIYEKKYFSCYA